MNCFRSQILAAALVAASTFVQPAASAAEKPVIEAEIPRGGDFVGFGFDALWMMSGSKLVRVNPADNSLTITPVEGASGSYRGVAIGEHTVWVPDVIAGRIHGFDPKTGTETMHCDVAMSDKEGTIAEYANSLWVVTTSNGGKTMARIGVDGCKLESEIQLPANGKSVVAAYGSIWVTGYIANALFRIDPASNAIVQTTPLGQRPRFATSGEDSVWVLNQGDGTVQRIDGHSGLVTATIEAGLDGGGGDIASGGGSVWIVTGTRTLAKVDPETNTIVNRLDVTGMGDALRYGADSVWISGENIYRLKPPN